MKISIRILTLVIFITSCNNLSTKENPTCDCCEKVYTNVDSALTCIIRHTDPTITTTENKLLLIAFVTRDLETNQKLGWNLLKDKDIIRKAKKAYILVVVDVNQQVLNGECVYDLRRPQNDEIIFVITNTAKCPFGQWSSKDKKEITLERLEVGIGP